MGDESKHDQQIPDDATVVKTDTSDIAPAAEQPPEDATVAAPRPTAVETAHKDQSVAANRPDVFTTRPTVSVPSPPPQSALRSRPVAIALGTVTGLAMFGLTALWLLHGR